MTDFKRALLAFSSLNREFLAQRLATAMIAFKLVVPDPENEISDRGSAKKCLVRLRSVLLIAGQISNARVNRARQGGFG